MSSHVSEEIPIEIAIEQLSSEALLGIIENFIFREGTDYGLIEVSHEAKVAQVRRQIERKEVRIIFDQKSDSVSLLGAQEYARLSQNVPGEV